MCKLHLFLFILAHTYQHIWNEVRANNEQRYYFHGTWCNYIAYFTFLNWEYEWCLNVVFDAIDIKDQMQPQNVFCISLNWGKMRIHDYAKDCSEWHWVECKKIYFAKNLAVLCTDAFITIVYLISNTIIRGWVVFRQKKKTFWSLASYKFVLLCWVHHHNLSIHNLLHWQDQEIKYKFITNEEKNDCISALLQYVIHPIQDLQTYVTFRILTIII